MPDRHPLRATITVEQLWQRVPGGSGTYVSELTRALARVPSVAVTGLAAAHRSPAPPADWPLGVPVRRAPLPRRVLYDAWQRAGAPRAEALVRGTQVVHATTWAVPPTRRPLVVTVHDLAFLDDPTHFTDRGNRFFRRALDTVRTRADVVVTPSRATADDCARHGIDPARVVVVPHGVEVTTPDARAVAAWRRRRSLDRDYVLWCGTVEPRKNVTTLLEAFARLGSRDLDLVLVGPRGWGDDVRLPAGLDPARVHRLGSVDRAELDTAYAGAAVFCFPSLREGFGLPVLEAMAHGVPVVTSAGTACAEVAGDAGVLVAPTDPGEVAAGLERALDERTGLARASRERAAGFTWSAAARATADAYARAAGSDPAGESRRGDA